MAHTNLILMVLTAALARGEAGISCYYRSATTSTSDGTVQSCTGNYCYAYNDYYGNYYAGCATSAGSCSSFGKRSCVICDSALCNRLTSSNLTCYFRSIWQSYSNGTVAKCAAGITNCFTSYADGEGGCGACYSSATDCKSCSSNNCNTQTNLKCYYQYYSGSRSVSTCQGSCYSYSYSLSSFSQYSFAGCGSCDATSTLYSNCKICTTDYCNSPASRILAGPLTLLLLLVVGLV